MATKAFVSSSKNLFENHAQLYSKFRPTHPKELISYLSGFCKERSLAWDVATGNGQAAKLLTEQFDSVIATDLSASQIANANHDPKISYQCEAAEDLNSTLIADNSVDLITVAVAIHWIPRPLFYQRVQKVLKPNGIIAAWSYWVPKVNPQVDAVHHIFDQKYLIDNDPPELRHIREAYTKLDWPFEKVENFETDTDEVNRKFVIKQDIDLHGYINRLSTYSTTQSYIRNNGVNPVELMYDQFLKAWGGDPNQVKVMQDELFLKVGRKPNTN